MAHLNRPFLISIGAHSILIVALWAFAYRASLFEEVPIELSEIVTRTASLNSVPEKQVKSKVEPSTKPVTSANQESATNTPKTNTPSSSAPVNPDSTYSGPVSEEYEVGEMPILLNEVRIPYPAEAKAKGVQGNVIFDLIVDREGKVVSAQMISSPDASLTSAATQAVRQFRFRPAQMADKPVAIKIRYSYRFILQ